VPPNRDESDFVDAEFQAARSTALAAAAAAPLSPRPPNREELEVKVLETQQRLEELRRAQSQLEKERAALEEARRRRGEYHTGREEMLQHLIRGIGLLEEAEFAARQDAEQMARTLHELREHQGKVQALDDQAWTGENYAVELTRALTTIENARMEWNQARLRWPRLAANPTASPARQDLDQDWGKALSELTFWPLCRLGLALTWPVALMVLLAAVAFAVAWFSRF